MGKKMLKCYACGTLNNIDEKHCSQCGNWLLDEYWRSSVVEGGFASKTSNSNNSNNKSLPNETRKNVFSKLGWFYGLISAITILLWVTGLFKTVDFAFYLLFLLPVILVIGIISPKTVIRWGQNQNRSAVLKIFLTLMLGNFIWILYLAGQDSIQSEVVPTNQVSVGSIAQTESLNPFAEEIAQIDSYIFSSYKGQNYYVGINDTDGKHIVTVNLDFSSFKDSFHCVKETFNLTDAIRQYRPELHQKIDIYKLNFFHMGLLQYSTVVDNSDKKRLAEVKLISALDSKVVRMTRDDLSAYYQAQAEEMRIAAENAYNTGVTYEQLARTPDLYSGKKVSFSGKVIQVLEGNGETQLRVAVSHNYDTILFAKYVSAITPKRVLTNDAVTIKGVSTGLYTYQSTLGGPITIPSVKVEIITID